jgi:hypothetical protein
MPIVILLIDNLNTTTPVQQQVQQQMLGYIKRMPPGILDVGEASSWNCTSTTGNTAEVSSALARNLYLPDRQNWRQGSIESKPFTHAHGGGLSDQPPMTH